MERDDYNNAFFEISSRRRVRRRIDVLLRAYSLMGVLIAILAVGYFMLTLLPFELSQRQQMALMVAGVGVALALMSRTLIIFRKEGESEELERLNEYQNFASFLDTWARFERVSKELLVKEGEEFNRHSLRSVISRLFEEGKIDKRDLAILEEALQARNSLVHGDRSLPTDLVEKITDALLEVIKKIAMPH